MLVELPLLALIGLLVLAALSGASTLFILAAIVAGARREPRSASRHTVSPS